MYQLPVSRAAKAGSTLAMTEWHQCATQLLPTFNDRVIEVIIFYFFIFK